MLTPLRRPGPVSGVNTCKASGPLCPVWARRLKVPPCAPERGEGFGHEPPHRHFTEPGWLSAAWSPALKETAVLVWRTVMHGIWPAGPVFPSYLHSQAVRWVYLTCILPLRFTRRYRAGMWVLAWCLKWLWLKFLTWLSIRLKLTLWKHFYHLCMCIIILNKNVSCYIWEEIAYPN